MSFIDAVIIGITLILAIKGFFNGFIKEIAGLVGIIGGLILASKFYHQTGVYINEHLFSIPNKSAIDLVGFIAVFVGFWLFAIFVGFLLGKILKISALGVLDRILGFVFSGAKFFLMIAVIAALLWQVKFLREKISNYTKNSIVYPVLLNVGEKIINITPEDLENISKNAKISINNPKGD
jgi:membrane protein required for colicin V production